ncbi:hypothetical protein QBC38DRAFT_448816 [Podospora fimiseda]|uniref:Bromodomain associated domain-containing protein n=1 Tax=Podospora fimiseda TaxID=252190 RepID=A0AAN7BFB0_9PEZI|nr:hypothetical protein QBC38DRAFT_448816 [Podospora fimiseda]
MTPTPQFYHALLRPAVIQILRSVGYHSAKNSVLDQVTDLAARYLTRLCELTATHASLNSSLENLPMLEGPDRPASAQPVQYPSVPVPSIIDVRLAFQDIGVLLPEKIQQEQDYLGIEDLRGVEQFIAWAAGSLNKEIQRVALDGNDEAHDYLDALKKKHSKNDDDHKYLGTILGRPYDQGEVLIEGGEFTSISAWEAARHAAAVKPVLEQPQINGHRNDNDSRPGSSGLSSAASVGDEMDVDLD